MSKEFPTQTVLELACAAQRFNKGYIKQIEAIVSDDNKVMDFKWENRVIVSSTLDPTTFKPFDEVHKPPIVTATKEDQELAEDIKKYYRRLMFVAVDGSNEFLTEVNSLLNSENVPLNKLGFIACLPSVYKRDYGRYMLEKRIKSADAEYLALIGDNILDADCEVLNCQRSKNFEAWNIDAIIDNKMVSWMSKYELKLGPAVIVKARVKDHSKHWKYENPVTRLNYVKAAQ